MARKRKPACVLGRTRTVTSFWPSLRAWLRVRAFLVTEHKVNLWSGLALIIWAKIVFWNSINLDQNPNYRIAVRIFDEDQWEIIAFTVGCIQLVGLLSGYRLARIVGTSLASWVFFTLGYSITVSGVIPPGVAMTWCWGAVNLHSMLSIIKRRKPDGCQNGKTDL